MLDSRGKLLEHGRNTGTAGFQPALRARLKKEVIICKFPALDFLSEWI